MEVNVTWFSLSALIVAPIGLLFGCNGGDSTADTGLTTATEDSGGSGSDSGTDTDTDSGGDTAADTDSGGDTETDTETGTDSGLDTGIEPTCLVVTGLEEWDSGADGTMDSTTSFSQRFNEAGLEQNTANSQAPPSTCRPSRRPAAGWASTTAATSFHWG